MSQITFGDMVKEYLRAAGYSQKMLASTLGLDRTVLTHKLNSTGRTVLTHPEIKQIVLALAQLEAITTSTEVHKLLTEANCPDFSAEEWKTKPLSGLEKRVSDFAFGWANSEKTSSRAFGTGTHVTLSFLFTDIEGSTALWEEQSEAMELALARHDFLVRKAIESHDGKVFKTVGDGFYAVFPTATQTAEAALAAQVALNAEKWDEAVGQLRVRMAIHSGIAEERNNDYFGQTLNRTARLLAVGHGGQILLSLVSAELIRDHLPDGATLQQLGEYRLKDLIRPELIFQLNKAELKSEFPPLRTLETFPTNLPIQLTSFVGREQELAQVTKLLASTRLLTLTGTGGVGKTRLALQVGADLVERYRDGIWLVELAPVTEAERVLQTVALTLGIKEGGSQPLLTSVINYLHSKQLLLVLDNCEHLIQAVAQLTEKLLQVCPNLQILATSREPLAIGGETSWRVPSLTVPEDSFGEASLENLSQYESVRLFIERAILVKPDFTVTNQTAPLLAHICYKLEGIPLAIELAAARVNMLTMEQLAERLKDRLRLLTGGSRTHLTRQQTLRALIDWSYELLSQKERALLERLAVFVGGWTLEAAETICSNGEVEGWETLDLLTQLTSKSLIGVKQSTDTALSQNRYSMLETIRQYATEKLEKAGEQDRVRQKHLEYYLSLAEEVEPKLKSEELLPTLRLLEEEHNNLREALKWAFDSGQLEVELRLAGALMWFWFVDGYLFEGGKWLEKGLTQASSTSIKVPVKAKALAGAGWLLTLQRIYAKALAYSQEALRLYSELGDENGKAYVLSSLGVLAYYHKDYSKAEALLKESLTIFRRINDHYGIRHSLSAGYIFFDQKRYEEAEQWLRESLAISQQMGYKDGEAWVLHLLGQLALRQEDYEKALALLEQSVKLYREFPYNPYGLGYGLRYLGEIALMQRQYERARGLLEESLNFWRKVGNPKAVMEAELLLGRVVFSQKDYQYALKLFLENLRPSVALGENLVLVQSLEGVALVNLALGRKEAAAKLGGVCESLEESFNLAAHFQMTSLTSALPNLRQQKLNTVFSKAWTEGRTMTLEQALGYAAKI